MSNMDFSDLGREIGDKVEKFVNSKEIKELQDNIKATVENTMQEVSRSMKEAAGNANKNMETGRSRMQQNAQTKKSGSYKEEYKGPQPARNVQSVSNTQPVRRNGNKRQLPVVKKPQGGALGSMLTVFGGIGAVTGWYLARTEAFFYIKTLLSGSLIGAAEISIPFLAACICTAAFAAGRFLRRRAKRFKKYVKAMKDKDFHSIEGLARLVEKSESFVKKDLKKMTRRGWFRQGHLDEQETCFMVTDDAYRMYQEAQKELERRREEEERLAREQELLEQDPVRKQLKITVEEGKEYIRRIREVNDKIPEEIISGKLSRLERICARIFEHVEENPEKLPDIRRFMSYYMPTTLKLVEAYQQFSDQPVQGENITTAKKEIEGMLDDIGGAFEKMFDKLFEDDAMDISTDISVLSTMLAQEGLLKDEFTIKKEGE